MDLKTAILAKHSKAQTQAITRQIGKNPDLFAVLWQMVLDGEPPLPQRASWILDNCVQAHPTLFEPYLEEAIAFLPLPNHNAVHRNLTKILARMDIPEDLQGQLYDLCINWLIAPQIAVAIKAHSMTIAANIAKGIPELEEELAFVINDQLEFNSKGFKARGRQVLKQLKKN